MRIILRDGTVAEFRPVRDNALDRTILHALFLRASAKSLYFRFFHAVREVSSKFIDSLIASDFCNSASLLCLIGDQALGIGTYMKNDRNTAEVAFLVDDQVQGKGVGTLLLEQMAGIAWRYGIRYFVADVLPNNERMLSLLTSSGYEFVSTVKPDTVRMMLTIRESERSQALHDTREKLATAASLTPFFRPQVVAVIGASRDPSRLGHILLRHLIDGGYAGVVYPVNPDAHAVASVRAYKSICEVPETVDLAIVVTAAHLVTGAVADCIQAGARAVLIVSAVSSGLDSSGVLLQEEIVGRLRAAGKRLIGPNSLGLINASGNFRLNASFAPHLPSAGGLSIASQSGALGIAILEYAVRTGVFVSSFVSMGNKADVSGNDLLLYWEDDPDTQMIVLYLESFGNPRKFSRISRRITQSKPLLVVKGARTSAGIAVSEAGPQAALSQDGIVDALFRQTGIIRANTLQELFDVAALLSSNILPKGPRVAILTNTAGGAVMVVDALIKQGLEFVGPPIDLGFEALAQGYRDVLPSLLQDEAVDAVIVLFIPVGVVDRYEVEQAICDAVLESASRASGSDSTQGAVKPVVANFLSTDDYLVRLIDLQFQKIPVYPFPEQAVYALSKVVEYSMYRQAARGHVPDLQHIKSEAGRTLVADIVEQGEQVVSGETVGAVLKSFGIQMPEESFSGKELMSDSIAIVIAEIDPLFGPVIGLYPGRNTLNRSSGMGNLSGLSILACPFVRIVPLTDVDAREFALVAIEFGQLTLTDAELQGLEELILRVSKLLEDIPEVYRLILSVMANDDHCGVLADSCKLWAKVPATIN